MTGMPETTWLYTRGPQSVHLVREENPQGCRLFVHGPEVDVVAYEFANVAECIKRQTEIELALVAEGYRLAQSSSDRRSEHRTGPNSAQPRAS